MLVRRGDGPPLLSLAVVWDGEEPEPHMQLVLCEVRVCAARVRGARGPPPDDMRVWLSRMGAPCDMRVSRARRVAGHLAVPPASAYA